MKRILVVLMALLLVASLSSCSKKEEYTPPASSGGGGTIDVNAYQKIQVLKNIVSKDRNNLKAWVMLGNLYFDTNQNEEAVKAYEEALRLNPSDPNVRTDMGICLRRLGRIDEAIEAFRVASSYQPDHYQSRYNLGLTLLHDKNDLQGALRVWEELLEKVPSFPGREKLRKQVESLKGIATEGGQKSVHENK